VRTKGQSVSGLATVLGPPRLLVAFASKEQADSSLAVGRRIPCARGLLSCGVDRHFPPLNLREGPPAASWLQQLVARRAVFLSQKAWDSKPRRVPVAGPLPLTLKGGLDSDAIGKLFKNKSGDDCAGMFNGLKSALCACGFPVGLRPGAKYDRFECLLLGADLLNPHNTERITA